MHMKKQKLNEKKERAYERRLKRKGAFTPYHIHLQVSSKWCIANGRGSARNSRWIVIAELMRTYNGARMYCR